jgi:hypothetical protein
MKKCTSCKRHKAVGQFYKQRRNKDGLQSQCKTCAKARLATARKIRRIAGELTDAQKTRQRLRREVLQHYGGENLQCSCPGCNVTQIEFLSIDHIDGGGHQHRKQIGESGLYTWLKRQNFPPGFRVLCHNCNQSMGAYGYCPHVQTKVLDLRTRVDKLLTAVLQAAITLHRNNRRLSARNLATTSGVSCSAILRNRDKLEDLPGWPAKLTNYQAELQTIQTQHESKIMAAAIELLRCETHPSIRKISAVTGIDPTIVFRTRRKLVTAGTWPK